MSLNAEVLAMAEVIEKGLTLDKNTGTGTGAVDLYESTLPEDLNMETVKKVSDHNTTFVAAGAYAAGKMAVDAMAGNKKLEKVTFDIPMGAKDNVFYTVDREKRYANRMAEGAEDIVKHGVVTTTYEVRAGKNSGQLKIARYLVSEIAAAAMK